MDNLRLEEVIMLSKELIPYLDGGIWGTVNVGCFRKDV